MTMTRALASKVVPPMTALKPENGLSGGVGSISFLAPSHWGITNWKPAKIRATPMVATDRISRGAR